MAKIHLCMNSAIALCVQITFLIDSHMSWHHNMTLTVAERNKVGSHIQPNRLMEQNPLTYEFNYGSLCPLLEFLEFLRNISFQVPVGDGEIGTISGRNVRQDTIDKEYQNDNMNRNVR